MKAKKKGGLKKGQRPVWPQKLMNERDEAIAERNAAVEMIVGMSREALVESIMNEIRMKAGT